MAFLELASELAGMLPGLSPVLAETYINRALQDIYREPPTWSFLQTDGMLVCPGAITTGSAAITQYTTTVTLNALASAALLAQTLPGAVPGIQNLQIRFGATVGTPSIGLLYSIVAADATTPTAIVLTVDRPVLEGTAATSAYQVYRALVTPPIPDFKKWESLVDAANSITIAGNRLTYTSTLFDQRDPQRMAVGLAYLLGSWGGNRTSDPVSGATTPSALTNAGTPIYELWPHPTSGQTFYCRIRRAGELLVNPTDEPPSTINDTLIINRALYAHAYPFAMANVANFPSFKGANWMMLIATARGEYTTALQRAKLLDDEQQMNAVMNRGHGLRSGRGGFKGDFLYPIDANFLQSHLIRW